jgi:hypothetical protein
LQFLALFAIINGKLENLAVIYNKKFGLHVEIHSTWARTLVKAVKPSDWTIGDNVQIELPHDGLLNLMKADYILLWFASFFITSFIIMQILFYFLFFNKTDAQSGLNESPGAGDQHQSLL